MRFPFSRHILLLLSLSVLLLLIPGRADGQFERRLSLNVSGGYFNTVGWNGWQEDWQSLPEGNGPTLMPNFKGGPAVTAGLQYNFSRHFSLEFQVGFSFAPGWYFDASEEDQEPYNYLYFEVVDPGSGTVVETGENYMDMYYMHLAVAPRYYFLPGRKLNPFVYAGISINYLDVWYENNEKKAYEDHGLGDEYEENAGLVNWFDYDSGIGFLAGAGAEFALNDYLGLFLIASYHMSPLNEEAFYYGTYQVNYHDLAIHLGVRYSFLKSKQL